MLLHAIIFIGSDMKMTTPDMARIPTLIQSFLEH